MCFGEGIHADCVDRDRVMNSKQKIVWPAGDDLEEDEVEEVNQCGNFRIFAKFRETNFSLSFFLQFEDEAWELSAQLMEELSPVSAAAASLF